MLTLLFVSFNTFAATQGTLGSDSSGSVEIAVVSNDSIIIHGLVDYNFGIWSTGGGTLRADSDVCIGKTSFSGPYAIRASGDGAGSDPAAFTLSNGTEQISYNVYWNDQVTPSGNLPLTAGLILHGQTGSVPSFAQNRVTCRIPNANLQVEILDTELQASTSGNYSGTLTLLVIPE